MTSSPHKPDRTSASRSNVVRSWWAASKHRQIGLIASIVVVVLAVSGTVAGANHANHQAELAAAAVVKMEKMEGNATPTPDRPMMGMLPSPTPSPFADVPIEPRTDRSPSPTPPNRPPIVSNPQVKAQPPREANPKPEIPEDTGPGEQQPDSGLAAPAPAAGIDLGQTTDEKGNPHALVLNVPDSARGAILHTEAGFAVISGRSRFSVTGDAAVDSWRFAVDSASTGEGAPIVVIKNGIGRTMQELAASPGTYTSAAELNEDVLGTSTRLTALIADVISKAEPAEPDSFLYRTLADQLLNPLWTGVMIFNATATVPGEVLGQPTGALSDSQVGVLNIGFEAPPMPGDSWPFFGTVALSQADGDELPPEVKYLRARFLNSALAAFEHG